MTRRLSIVAVLALCSSPARAELIIDPDCRVANISSGYCAWCNLEMLGRQYRIKSLHGLVKRRAKIRFWRPAENNWVEDGSAGVVDLAAELDKLELKYKLQHSGSLDPRIIMDACAGDLGAIVSVRNYPATGDHHSILVTSWPQAPDDDITFIDCNALWSKTGKDKVPQVRACNLAWFAKHWTGAALVLIPPTPKPVPKPEVTYVSRRPIRPTQPDYPFKDASIEYQPKVAPAAR